MSSSMRMVVAVLAAALALLTLLVFPAPAAAAWPVAGGHISQGFHGDHYAVDIAAPAGTRVRAAGSGTVVFAGWRNNGGGYQVWLYHGHNNYTTYNHMSRVSVSRGQKVKTGTTVGRVGMTGNATGPHLHFEAWKGYPWNSGSKRINPSFWWAKPKPKPVVKAPVAKATPKPTPAPPPPPHWLTRKLMNGWYIL